LGLIAICTTVAVASIALQTSIQTQNFIQNWTKDAHTMWATQAQTDEEVQDKIQELETAIQRVGDLLATTDYIEIEESKGICFLEK